jgi:biopolymer transport protein TolQ
MHGVLLQAAELSTYGLIADGSAETKIVLAICAVLSVVSWVVIFAKWREFRRVDAAGRRFFGEVERADGLAEAYHAVSRLPASAHQRVFRVGVSFVNDVRPGGLRRSEPGTAPAMAPQQIDALKLLLGKEVSAEREALAHYVPWLATIGATGPLLGLLGTVLGVMDSFLGVATSGSGNIAAVAPGVAEALITTAAGLVAAIPAVIFYNVFVVRVRRIAAEIGGFATDLIGTLAREGLL